MWWSNFAFGGSYCTWRGTKPNACNKLSVTVCVNVFFFIPSDFLRVTFAYSLLSGMKSKLLSTHTLVQCVRFDDEFTILSVENGHWQQEMLELEIKLFIFASLFVYFVFFSLSVFRLLKQSSLRDCTRWKQESKSNQLIDNYHWNQVLRMPHNNLLISKQRSCEWIKVNGILYISPFRAHARAHTFHEEDKLSAAFHVWELKMCECVSI